MPTSLRKITEQSSRLYARRSGRQTTKAFDLVEIRNLIIQSINTVLSAQYQAQDDQRNIPACIIATYANQTVTGSECTLPAQPIKLPRDRGIHQVGPDDETSERYIPIQSSDWELFRSMTDDEGGLEGIIGFFREGNTIRFTSAPGANVRIKLLVADPGSIGKDDVLPLSADQEKIVIEDVVNTMVGSGVSEA